jgi:hypothetical protein
MPAKKEESHDCKAECAELHKQLAALKKEVLLLKKEFKSKSSGGADPRVDVILELLKQSNAQRKFLEKKGA